MVRLQHLPGTRWYQDGLTKTGGVLLQLLSDVLGVTLEVEDVIRVPRKKPQLDVKRRPEFAEVDFSIAASGPWAALAVSGGGRVGIDIEVERHFELTPELMDLVTHPAEHVPELMTGAQRPFFEVWTRKEAVLKAAGAGLSMKPAEVRLEADLAWKPDGRCWHVRCLTGPSGVVIAVACSSAFRVRRWVAEESPRI